MSDQPSPTTNGSTKTQFQKGNAGGPGSPFVKQLAALRAKVYQQITKRGIEKTVAMLITKAEGGDVAAAKIILQYAAGQPTQPIEMSGSVSGPAPVIVVRDFGTDDGSNNK